MRVERFQPLELTLFSILGFTSIVSTIVAFYLQEYILLVLPLLILLILASINNFKLVFLLLLFVLPLSTEFHISPQLAINLPSEPLIISLFLLTVIFLFLRANKIPIAYFRQHISVLLLVHLLWTGVTVLHSEETIVSLKFLISKFWYIMVFFILAALIFQDIKNIRRAFWAMYIPLTIVILVTMVRHGLMGFTFEDVNEPVRPFFRNHVMYASMISVFYPFLFLAAKWYRDGSWKKRLINFSKILYLAAVYFSFTRAAMLSLVVALLFIPVVYWKLTKAVILTIIVVIIAVIGYLVHDNKYLDYAPEFEKTVYHDEFNEHIAATVALEDASSMERFYRWIAAAFMFQDRPWMGYGPGNFYPFYKKFTVSSFETYLSQNKERSTVHNYLLLLLVEQGFIGLGIFLILSAVLFLTGERVYHSMNDPELKRLSLTVTIALIIIYVNLMFSDLIETDKIGSLFFICLAILVNLDLYSRGLLDLAGKKANIVHE